ncbi:MAG: glycosyltransferase [Cytophaga sp.]|uniref:glycosyltransferase n=1 Tax=Cytophaga sp. TaxID=29535 RepID=UPI003F8017B8
MNRLHHIQLTLPKNIRDNLSYPDVEFILLDYNSTDGLEAWVQSEMSVYIASGILKYYKTTVPQYFHRSHSRNMAFQCTAGDIVCNLDADNFTGPDFAAYINQCFVQDETIFLVSAFNEEYLEYKDAYGRVCMWRQDFFDIGGYDESMESYGHEDTDLYDRLSRHGRKESHIMQTQFLNSIPHDDKQRTSNEYFSKNLDRFYLAYNGDKTLVLFLFKDKKFEMGTLVENHYSIPTPSSIEEGNWIKGDWEESTQMLRLYKSDRSVLVLHTDNNRLNYIDEHTGPDRKIIYSKITNPIMLQNTLLSYSIITNSNQIHLNEQRNITKVNLQGFGQGTAYKNFDPTLISI